LIGAAVMSREVSQQNYLPAVFWSVLLHIGIFGLLAFHFDFTSSRPVVAAQVIEAVVVDAGVLDALQTAKERATEQKRLEQQRKLDEVQKLEQQRKLQAQQKLEQEKARKLQEKIKLENARKLEQQKQEAARKAEEQQKLDAAQRVEEQREQEIAQERARRAADAAQLQAQEIASAKDLYILAIRQKVERNWLQPPSARSGDQCRVVIRQIPGGEVVDVRVEACTGDDVFQRSVEHAVYMASPLPEAPDPRVFDRQIGFDFKLE
jgi:colicin import membrane protein